eukprot:403333840
MDSPLIKSADKQLPEKRMKKPNQLFTPISQTTRKKTIDFSKVGQKITLSDFSCHRCKTMIPVNEENVCNGPIIDDLKKTQNTKKKIEPCQKRFCNECLQKYNKDSWNSLNKSKINLNQNSSADPEIWVCPFCLELCTCSQCNRKRTKEGQMKNQFLAQFDIPETKQANSKQDKSEKQTKKQQELLDSGNKRQDKMLQKMKSKHSVEAKKGGRKPLDKSDKIAQQNFANNSENSLKQAVTDNDWNAYLQSKQNFINIINKHDWQDSIPALEILKVQINQQIQKKEERSNERSSSHEITV